MMSSISLVAGMVALKETNLCTLDERISTPHLVSMPAIPWGSDPICTTDHHSHNDNSDDH